VAHHDAGAGGVEVEELRQLSALEEQQILGDSVGGIRDDLEGRIAAVHLSMHPADVVGDRDRLGHLAGAGEEILKLGDLPQHLRVLDSVLTPGVHHDVEILGAAQRAAEVLDALADAPLGCL